MVIGAVSLWSNLFKTWGPGPQHFLYITLVFSFSLVFSALALVFWKRPVPRKSFPGGKCWGSPTAL
ncbi:MAG: hypothetical protein QF922_00330 [SAR324 cluster bacterium]|nr:hypothetical protein [SAR324 cluster bacterium]